MKIPFVAGLAAAVLCGAAQAQVVGPYSARDAVGRSFTFYVAQDGRTGNLVVKNLSVPVDAGKCQQVAFNDPLTLEQHDQAEIVDGNATVVFNFSTYYGEVRIRFDDKDAHTAHGSLFAVGAVRYPSFSSAPPWRSQICKSGKIAFEADGPP